jgi:hypothetical protein
MDGSGYPTGSILSSGELVTDNVSAISQTYKRINSFI